MREACQMVSYEIPLGISIIVAVMAAGTLNMVQMSQMQGGGIHTWIIFRNPFVFLAFFMYYIASLASCKRAPFDLPESESELVAGFHTEYSGFRWSLIFFAEYAAMYVVCALATTLFLGGWLSPLPDSWAPQGDSIGARAIKGLLFNGRSGSCSRADCCFMCSSGFAGRCRGFGLTRCCIRVFRYFCHSR